AHPAAAAVVAAADLTSPALTSVPSAASPLPEHAASSPQGAPDASQGADPSTEENAAPALAGGAKEEVVYAKLDPSGQVQRLYTVNHFGGTAGRTITDYGDYTAVRNMTTTDPIAYANGAATP